MKEIELIIILVENINTDMNIFMYVRSRSHTGVEYPVHGTEVFSFTHTDLTTQFLSYY